MNRVFAIAGLCALAIVIAVGRLGRSLHDHQAGHRRDIRHARLQQDVPGPGQRQVPPCHHCAIPLADLALSDATFDGVTITNHGKHVVEAITFEVTMTDCPPGYDPANSADRCVTAGRQNKEVDVFIPPGQVRGFRSVMNFHVPLPPQRRRFVLWRIVSAKTEEAR